MDNNCWEEFVKFVKDNSSSYTSFHNWIEPIKCIESTDSVIKLEIPNIFVKDYLLRNYKDILKRFCPLFSNGELAIEFVIGKRESKKSISHNSEKEVIKKNTSLNDKYTFASFIEGPSNQFVKSAAFGVSNKPGKLYNPLFIQGKVGLGKTHLLHSIGNEVFRLNKKAKICCITAEALINELVDSLKNKAVDGWKNKYRKNIDLLLIDDIQFLQDRINFEEEFCNTFEELINKNKQLIVTSDKLPGQLKLSERMIARMEWGLIAQIGSPDLETRVAIIKSKAEQKGIELPNDVAFYIAENIDGNVRQLEGAINKISAQSKILNLEINKRNVFEILKNIIRRKKVSNVSFHDIIRCVALVFQVKPKTLLGSSRKKNVVLARQIAMFLSRDLLSSDTLSSISDEFGRTHSTILYAYKSISKKIKEEDEIKNIISDVKLKLKEETHV